MDDDPSLLVDIVRAVLTRADGPEWGVVPGEFWCMLRPPEARLASQGWKLHVSATQLTAPVVLARVAEVLVAEGCAFKFARGRKQLAELLSNRCERGAGGKFITVYPQDDEQFRGLAAKLDQVTDGLPGPKILSDRQLRQGSSVYYRYGVFTNSTVFTNDGRFDSMLTGPQGQLVKDERPPSFNPPSWAVLPLQESEPDGMAANSPSSVAAESTVVLIGGRFAVHGAIRHSYRGGVYRATDQVTGTEVVLKQARPHVMSSLIGTDACDMLRHEAQILDLLGPVGLAPHTVALVSHQENLFLAEEQVPGVTLRRWVADRAAEEWRGAGVPWADAIDKVGKLMDILAAVHERDLVLRDLKPDNLMVTPDGSLRLIDLEGAARVGSRVSPFGTPGYVAPELAGASHIGPAPSPSADLFSLGATVMYLASGIDPVLPSDKPTDRPNHERLDTLLGRAGTHMASLRRLGPLVKGLMRDDPDRRWSLRRAQDFLAIAAASVAGQSSLDDSDARPATAIDRLLVDGLRHLLRTATPDGPCLWVSTKDGRATDTCNVQHGAAGVLGVLTRAAHVLDDERLREGVAMTAGWIDRRLFDIPKILPGLYFGRSGTAWALHDAARLLGDTAMATGAIELAKRIPMQWPNPDICHGTAGAGMTQLHLWTGTGDPRMQQRGIQAANSVLQAALERDGHLTWPVPMTFDSTFAGQVNYGFAHGTAGIGCFLLYTALATGRPEYLDAARRAGDALEAVADTDGKATWWPVDAGSDPKRKRHWCHGSSGVGTFLIRLWVVTGESRFRELADAAATAVFQGRWYSTNAACHGLPGDGDFLLDLADFTGEHRYRAWAWELASVMHARHTIRDGLTVLADTPGAEEVTADYNTGLSGALAFLLRLRHGGPRGWMPDQLLHHAGTPSRAPASEVVMAVQS